MALVGQVREHSPQISVFDGQSFSALGKDRPVIHLEGNWSRTGVLAALQRLTGASDARPSDGIKIGALAQTHLGGTHLDQFLALERL